MLAQSNTSRRLRAVIVALFTLASASVSSAAHADFGTVWTWELKGGWFIGGSGAVHCSSRGAAIHCRSEA